CASCGSRLQDSSLTSRPFLKASRRMPSSLRSKIHSGPLNRSCVSVAAIGSTHSGNPGTRLEPAHAPRLEVDHRLADLARAVHHERAHPHDGLVDRLAA